MTRAAPTTPYAPDNIEQFSQDPVLAEPVEGDLLQVEAPTIEEEEAEPPEDPGTPPDARALILVVGSGRSGTSLITGVMQRLGFHVPQPEVVADETNPKGFGEPQWVVDFHTRLLQRASVHTTDARPAAWAHTAEVGYDVNERGVLAEWLAVQFEVSHRLVIKDPRLLWFMPLWSRAAEDIGVQPGFVTMLRHPSQVVASKERWYDNMNNPPNRLAGWVNTALYTERATRTTRRAFVVFDRLLSDWTQSIAGLDERLDLGILRTVRLGHMQAVAQFIDPNLRRSQEGWEELDVPKPLSELAERVWSDLLALAGDGEADDQRILTRLDNTREEYSQLYADAESVAFSSVLAARRAGKRAGETAARRAQKPAEVAVPRRQSPLIRVRAALGGLGRSTPVSLKKLLPEAIKAPLRRRLS
jgi:hypothetical protein